MPARALLNHRQARIAQRPYGWGWPRGDPCPRGSGPHLTGIYQSSGLPSPRTSPGCLQETMGLPSAGSQHNRVSRLTGGQTISRRPTAEGRSPSDMVLDEYRWETSLSRMTRVATEAQSRSHTTAQWISDHVIPNGRTAFPGGVALDRSSFECESRLPAGITSCCQATLLLQDPFGVGIRLDK